MLSYWQDIWSDIHIYLDALRQQTDILSLWSEGPCCCVLCRLTHSVHRHVGSIVDTVQRGWQWSRGTAVGRQSCPVQHKTKRLQTENRIEKKTQQKKTAYSVVYFRGPGRVRWRSGEACFSQGRSRRVCPRHSRLCGAVATEQSFSRLCRSEGWGQFKS